jgi:putative ABC transport system permease protein
MIKSYIKLAWRVLRRNPFFTGVSLFGISFTLAVLMLMVAYLQNQFGSNPPLSNADSLIYFRQLQQSYVKNDTIWRLDSTLVDNVWKVDSVQQTVDNANRTSRSQFSLEFLQRYFSKDKLTSAENVSFLNYWTSYDVFQNNKKYHINAHHVDEEFFDIFDFKIQEGRVFNTADIDQRALNAVIRDDLAKKYFGKSRDIIGESIHIDNHDFIIIGVVPKAKVNNCDIFLPISYMDPTKDSFGYFGSFGAVVKSRNKKTQATLDEVVKLKHKH